MFIKWKNKDFTLLAERAVYSHETETLIMTDPHFGKSECFRSFGIPVPPGSTESNLKRLSAALEKTNAKRLLILGDFFHGKASQSPRVHEILRNWRSHHPELQIILILGNHDVSAGRPPADLNIQIVEDDFFENDILFCHEPKKSPSKLTFAGHVHPGIVMKDGISSLRLPCFYFQNNQVLLPAFGEFTGLFVLNRRDADKVFVCSSDKVFDVSC